MFVKGGNGGSGPVEDDGGDFVRHAYVWGLLLGVLLYLPLAAVILHDRYLIAHGALVDAWVGELFARQGLLGLALGCILFVPGIALLFLGRWFESRDNTQ